MGEVGVRQHSHTQKGVSAWARLHFYGMHGLFDEIFFTAIFDMIFQPEGNRNLKGYSTIFSYFIYGSCGLLVERVYVQLLKRRVPYAIRIFTYVAILYIWEFTNGLILRQFDACSWDYSHYTYNFMGLITLEYLPFWLPLTAFHEIIFHFLLNLSINISTDGAKDTNDKTSKYVTHEKSEWMAKNGASKIGLENGYKKNS